jgi:hypothetical protein
LVAQLKLKFIVSTAFTAANSTITAGGRYGLKGSLGFRNGSMMVPTLTVLQPLLPSIAGVSLGAGGIVFAFEVRSLLGLGVPAAMSGPYVKLITSVGISRGSDLGLVQCKGTTLKLDAGAGMGAQASIPAVDMLEKLLGKKPKIDIEVGEIVRTVFDSSTVSPDVPLCGGKRSHS